LRLGEADLGDGDRVGDLDRVAERGVGEQRGDAECAERGRLGDLVGDRSRIGLPVRDGERAGDGERDGMVELIRARSQPLGILKVLRLVCGSLFRLVILVRVAERVPTFVKLELPPSATRDLR
jgi:hypothetical protein